MGQHNKETLYYQLQFDHRYSLLSMLNGNKKSEGTFSDILKCCMLNVKGFNEGILEKKRKGSF